MSKTLQQLVEERESALGRAIEAAVEEYKASDKSLPPCCPNCGEPLLNVRVTYVEEVEHTETHSIKIVDFDEAVTRLDVEVVSEDGEQTDPETHCVKCSFTLPCGFFDACGLEIEWATGFEDDNEPDCILTADGFVRGV